MGSGLCRSTDGTPRAAGVDGMYRKIVFNYAKQWTRSNKRPKRDKTNMKHNKRDKPIISGPFPVDPDRLEGDKWRYVILTRLDTEPPPERPPRTKRRRRAQQQQEQCLEDTVVDDRRGLWDSVRRRRSHARSRPPPPPPRPCRRWATARAAGPYDGRPAAAELMERVVTMTIHRLCGRGLPVHRSLPWPCDRATEAITAAATDRAGKTSSTRPLSWWPAVRRVGFCGRGETATCSSSSSSLDRTNARRNGLFASIGRITAMTDDMLSTR